MLSYPRVIGASVGLLLVALTIAPSANAEFTMPPNDGFFTDAAGIVPAEKKLAIEEKLRLYKESTSNEIAVVIVKSLGGFVIEDIALDIGRDWGVGSEKNNGILMLVAYEEREIRIEVGYGLEGAVPDIVAQGIIDTDIAPHFRDGDYAGGISAAIEALEKHIGNEYTAERYKETQQSFFGPFGFFLVLMLLQWLVAILSRTKSWWLGGVVGGVGSILLVVLYGWWLSIPIMVILGLLLDFFVSRNYRAHGQTSWWAGGGWGPGGGGFGGGRGGGFGGFGGGSFGGGGASGRW